METGETSYMLKQIRDVPNATTERLRENIIEVFQAIGAKDLHTKLVCIWCDGASVNLGEQR